VKAIFLTGKRQMELRDVPRPHPAGDQDVLIRVATVGVCGSDMHYYRDGRIGGTIVQHPWRIGHECAGTVVEIGRAVTNVKPGDRVAIEPLVVCGQCDQCRANRTYLCRNQGFLGVPGQREGSIAEYLVMPGECCVPIPDHMTFTQATMVEPLTIGLHARRLAGEIRGANVAIFGTGPIGLSVLMALRLAGAATVFVTDLLDNRLELAGRLGADWTGNAGTKDVIAEIGAQVPGGLEVAFECAGRQETIDHCAQILAPQGMAVLVGIPALDRISFPMDPLRRRELRIQNVRRHDACIPWAMDLVARGKVDVDALVTHRFPLAAAQEAFELVGDYRDNVVKAMIHVDPDAEPGL